MKLKKIVVLALIPVILMTAVFTIDTLFPKKVEAGPEFLMVVICCISYAIMCPPDVQDLCYSDCMDWNCGLY